MRSLARVATRSLVALFIVLALMVFAAAFIGILSTRVIVREEDASAGGEVTTAVLTSQLARNIDAAYTTGEQAALAAQPAERSRLLGSLDISLLPAVEAELFSLGQLHVGDPPAELADLELFVRQWAAVRDLMSRENLTSPPAGSLAAQLTAAYQPVSAHLDRLILQQLADANTDHARVSASSVRAIGLLFGVEILGLAIGVVLLELGIRRIHRELVPSRDQAEFEDALRLASDEDETYQLLRHHLERTLTAATAVVVLNRNNSADRLEAVTPLPQGSPLAGTLRGAVPRSCLAVRSGQTHREGGGRPALLSCPICAVAPGASSCVPLTVGGEVIGSVLLSRPAPTPYTEAEEHRIYESVGQAAPVLANLRNLAVAEIRAATDGLTGLPNKRAVADALKRTFAQATITNSPLGLLLLDIDLFKQVNDQYGHAAGDQVLASVGAALRSVLRDRDFAGRNGGEEFAILLPDTEVAPALEVAERVRAAIAEITVPGTDVPVTASIGVAGYPGHASTLDRLERLADAALYVAKRQGRNRVEPASADAVPDQPGPPADESGPVPVAVHRDARA